MKQFASHLFLVASLGLPGQAKNLVSWNTIGNGVQASVAPDATGNDVFIAFGGWTVQQAWNNTWVEALYADRLKSLGVKFMYSVQGPKNDEYKDQEIDNTALAKDLISLVKKYSNKRIILVAHSSGAYVAQDFLNRLYKDKLDSAGVTANKIAYFCLDGGLGSSVPNTDINAAVADKLSVLYAVYAFDSKSSIYSPNKDEMIQMGQMFGAKSKNIVIQANASGCTGEWCVHETLINQKPHNKEKFDLQNDYSGIDSDHPVVTAYLDVLMTQ